MEKQIERKVQLCEQAENPDWEDVVLLARDLDPAQRAFLNEHPPGLVKALWSHFDATRGLCGCKTPAHERPRCAVGLIERLLLDQQSA